MEELLLVEPDFNIDVHTEETERFVIARGEMRGYRETMEDRCCFEKNLCNTMSYISVFDGHGGQVAPHYINQHISKYISDNLKDFSFEAASLSSKTDLEARIRKSIKEIDHDLCTIVESIDERMLKQNPHHQVDESGTTLCSVLLFENKNLDIVCVNAGDSRCVLFDGESTVQLSDDHKPYNAAETNRIINAGGFLEDNRINGDLSVSRGLGDFRFKKNDKLPQEQQILTCDPDFAYFTFEENSKGERFIVVACDGLYDVMSSQDVVDYVRKALKSHPDLSANNAQEVLCDLMNHCVKDLESADNVSVVLVFIK
ncbi:protein phosphatase [Acrasis kona]|uniref:protein-serine/threonine phosphatase n=1 Tax=Acrasis kona TaxID=1008807 RepID=A0AAW2ZAT9_9EUKA